MNAPITPQQLPSGFCPTTFQDLWNGLAAAGFVTIPDALSQIVWQTTKPADTTVTWGQLDSLGRPMRLYRFAQGAWLSFHTLVPGTTIWWFQVLPNFTLFDGGDANGLSQLSGPMWQQAVDSNGNVIAAQFPLAVGTLPSGKVLNLGDIGGEENHSLTLPEVTPHTHGLTIWGDGFSIPDFPNTGHEVLTADNKANRPSSFTTQTMQTLSSGGDTTKTPPVVVGHNTMPPYVVGYLLQRTTRLFYAVT